MVSDLQLIHIYQLFEVSPDIGQKAIACSSGRHENDFAPNAVAEGFDTLTVIKKHNIELLKTQEVTMSHLR